MPRRGLGPWLLLWFLLLSISWKKSQNFMHHWFEIFTTTVRSSSLSTCSRLCIVALWGYKWVFWLFFFFFYKISCLVNHNQYNAKVHLDTWNLLCVFGWSIHTYYMQTFFFYTTCKAQLTVSTCTCIYNIFHRINNIHDSFLMDFTAWWVPFTHEYQSSTNYETKFFFYYYFS